MCSDIFSGGMDINGSTTWVLATLIVWLVAVLAAIILPVLLVKKAVTEARN